METTTMTMERRVAKRVREARRRAGLTQEVLANRANISHGYLARIETGRHEPSLTVLAKLARVLGVTVANLVE